MTAFQDATKLQRDYRQMKARSAKHVASTISFSLLSALGVL